MKTRPALFACAALFALASSARAEVLRVGGPNADFDEIQEAVTAAAEGDTILVRPGSYGTFTVDDKDLRIVGQAPNVETRLVRVNDLSSGKTVLLHGLRVTDSSKDGLILSGNQGSVRVQHCEFHGRSGDGTSHPEGWIGVRVLSCADVAFSDVVARGGVGHSYYDQFLGGDGGSGMHVVESNVALDRVHLEGRPGGSTDRYTDGYAGGHGLRAEGSFVSVSGSTMIGGNGGGGGEDTLFDPCFLGDGGPGGDALSANGSTVWLRDATYEPGAGGPGGFSLSENCHGAQGAPGTAVDATSSTVDDLPGSARSLDAPGSASEGSTIQLVVRGEPGDRVYLYRSAGAAFAPRGARGVWLVDLPWLSHPAGPYAPRPPMPLMPLGVIGPNGVLAVPYSVGSLPAHVWSRAVHLQVLARGSAGSVLTDAAVAVVAVGGSG